jgi:hypothetical protein
LIELSEAERLMRLRRSRIIPVYGFEEAGESEGFTNRFSKKSYFNIGFSEAEAREAKLLCDSEGITNAFAEQKLSLIGASKGSSRHIFRYVC